MSPRFVVPRADRPAVALALASVVLLFGVLVALRLVPDSPVADPAADLAGRPGVIYRGELARCVYGIPRTHWWWWIGRTDSPAQPE